MLTFDDKITKIMDPNVNSTIFPDKYHLICLLSSSLEEKVNLNHMRNISTSFLCARKFIKWNMHKF